MRHVLISPFSRLVPFVLAIILLAGMNSLSFAEDQAAQLTIGYRQFDAAAYHRTDERYDRAQDTWGDHSSSRPPSFRIVRSNEQGVNKGTVYKLFYRNARSYKNNDPAIGGINNSYELFRQGDATIFGLPYEPEDRVADAPIVFDPKPPLGFPMFPQNLDQLSEGANWTIKAPIVAHTYKQFTELAEAYGKDRKAQMDTTVSFRWADTLNVDGHKCAKIVFSMSDVEKIEGKGMTSEIKLEGVSYFSLDCGLPVSDTLITERIRRKNDKVVEHKKWRLSKQLILVSPQPSQIKEPLPLLPDLQR